MQEDDERFLKVGDETLAELQSGIGLGPDSVVVDIGCGYGRLAHALLRWSGFRGRYHGLDILPKHIDWCERSLSPYGSGRFRFEFLNIQNDRYNPTGAISAEDVHLPCADGGGDRVVLLSVFTHMYPQQILHYLSEIRRILAPDGAAYATFLLLDPTWADLERAGKTAYKLPHELTPFCRYMDADDPLWAIAYDPRWVAGQIESAGLRLLSPISLGTWRGTEGKQFQDVILMGRR